MIILGKTVSSVSSSELFCLTLYLLRTSINTPKHEPEIIFVSIVCVGVEVSHTEDYHADSIEVHNTLKNSFLELECVADQFPGLDPFKAGDADLEE